VSRRSSREERRFVVFASDFLHVIFHARYSLIYRRLN
jgi:hypothetical protein